MNPKVDLFLSKVKKWQEEMTLLRYIVLECGLTEEFKWMHPCYTSEDKNIVLIHAFKDYCALLLFKGVLLEDPHRILIRQTENVQDRRQIRFTSVEQIQQQHSIVKAYILEAIKIEKSGAKVEFKETSEFVMPQEFQAVLDRDRAVKAAFESLTPGRQRGYLLYFSGAKQSRTRDTRIMKYLPRILEGKGLDD
ncbi:MAG TPA: YdeI/OmpD-associated family protein [Sphingobacteriaceae bacterium]